MSSYEAEGLRITAVPDHNGLKICFFGRSDQRQPATIMNPWFEDLLPMLTNQHVHVDFCPFEYMNSSSFMPIFQFLQEAANSATALLVTYDNSKDWQRLSFSSLTALASGWNNFTIEAR